MKRRNFLGSLGTAVSIPMLLQGLRLSATPRSPFFNPYSPADDRVLVLIQLNGGNDGLNMVFPIDQYDKLAKVRANLLLPQDRILKVNDLTGIHPSMTGLYELFQKSQAGIVQSVGYPNQNRSHFRSIDIWQTASPANQDWNTGWLGRYFQSLAPDYPNGYPGPAFPDPFAITIGSTVSQTCQGTVTNYSLTLSDPNVLVKLTESKGTDTPDTPYGLELDFLRSSILQSNAYATTITNAAKKGKNQVTYPSNNGLATQLKNIALLISGGLQTKVYIAQIGGFDTHANQVDATDKTRGSHANLLGQLSAAIAAFQSDLKLMGLEHRVLGITFSEFGRQIASNASVGTDHGTAAPLFVFGSCVKAPVLGANPQIADRLSPQEGVAMQADFRDVYGSILKDWFEVPEAHIKSLIRPDFTYLPILKNCSLATPTREVYFKDIAAKVFPNPFTDTATLSFECPGGWTRISLYDALGSELMVLAEERMAAGEQTISFQASHLAAGNYYLRIQGGDFGKTTLLVKAQ